LGNTSRDALQLRLRELEVPRDRVLVSSDRLLGEGEFGVVVLGQLSTPGGADQAVAVKMLRSHNADEQELFLLEVHLTSMLMHPRIVAVLATCTKATPFMAVLEHMQGGDLRSHLKNASPRAPPVQLINVCQQIASAVGFLKGRKVIHRDLAARNVLVGSSLDNVKLADFGMSKSLDTKLYYRKLERECVPVKWLAPECLQQKIFTHESDIWSYGVVMWEVFSHGALPYEGMTGLETAMAVGVGTRLPQPGECPDEVYQLMLNTWSFDPEQRIPIAEIQEALDAIVTLMSGRFLEGSPTHISASTHPSSRDPMPTTKPTPALHHNELVRDIASASGIMPPATVPLDDRQPLAEPVGGDGYMNVPRADLMGETQQMPLRKLPSITSGYMNDLLSNAVTDVSFISTV